MSFWTRLGVKITDLGCFKASCQEHGVEYTLNEDPNFMMQGLPVHATLRDTQGGSGREAYLVREGGGYKMVIDNDQSYSSLSKRLGQNGGRLTRDYARNVIDKNICNSGGIVNSVEEQADGSLIVRASKL